MPVLDDADIAVLRAIEDDNKPHRARLQTPDSVEKTTGGWATEYVDYAFDLPARLSPLTGSEAPVGTMLTPETNFHLSLPYGTPIAERDRAVVTGTTNGIPWEVTVGVTFVAVPKAFSVRTSVFCTDRMEQIAPLP